MACRFCQWLCRWLCPDSVPLRTAIWDASAAWERAESNEWELWSQDTEENHELTERAHAIREADPEASFRLFLEAAEAGSVWGMESVGWHYDTGTVVPADYGKAQEYYYRALCAGSWMATIGYADLLAKHGYFDHCKSVLEDGVNSDFVPSYFWLAWFRYKWSPTRKTCREIRPLLEYAAEKGHPGAQLTLARLMGRGKFGIRKIPEGFRRGAELVSRYRSGQGPEAAVDQPADTSYSTASAN